ncbi:HAMP domain-containing protein, partial [bacterium]|nr:HAMP domain-containing protein [bacterium]
TVLLISTVAFFITRSITKPLEKTVAYTKTIASGKFKEDLNIKSNDELGIMVMSMNTMRKSLRDMIKEIMSGISQLNNSANDLTGFSDQVSQMAVENADKANSVSAATEEMSTNMDMVAENMETSSMNTDSVVTAVEEMTSTINEIAQNTDRAMRITEQAVEQSQAASNHMNQLGEVAQDIGKVTEVINGISEQTNMLSLNATIEAARAGENGKGFAVVAGEIKALADLTARSTKDIRGQIEKIQSSTKNSIEEIDVVSKIISEVSMIVTTIATALEEQSIATSEIASNIAVVSQRITEVSGSVTESSAVTKEITQSVADIHMSTDEMSGNSDQVKNSAKGLSDLAIKLDALMKNFTI